MGSVPFCGISLGPPSVRPIHFVAAFDRGLEVDASDEGASSEPSFGERGEEALDGVEPGGASRGEMKGAPRVSRRPGDHLRMLVSGVVVENEVHGRDGLLDGVEEADELLMAMALHAAADDLALKDLLQQEPENRVIKDEIKYEQQ